jgi:hypothetical protein
MRVRSGKTEPGSTIFTPSEKFEGMGKQVFSPQGVKAPVLFCLLSEEEVGGYE